MLKRILNTNPVYLAVFCAAFYSFVWVIQAQFEPFSDQIVTFLQLGAIAGFVFYMIKVCNDFYFENKYFKFIFYVFLAYQASIILRGIEINYQIIKYNLSADYILWPSLIPLVIFVNKDDLTFFYFIKAFYYSATVFLFFTVIDPFLVTHRSTAEPFILPLVFTSGFIFLNAKYVSRKVTLVAFISLVIGLLSFTYLARRNAIASFGALIFCGFYFMLRNLKVSKLIRLIPLFVGMIILLGLSIDKIIPDSLTSKLNERLTEDTRSDVFDNFFRGVDGYMVFGKGMRGTYYSPIDEVITDDGVEFGEVQNRDVIENGYLQLLLNGGYVNIVLFVLTLLPAAILGIFRSQNQLTRTCGVVILLWLIDMSVYGMPRLVMQYVLVWMCAGVCYQESFRQKSEEEIVECFEEVGLA